MRDVSKEASNHGISHEGNGSQDPIKLGILRQSCQIKHILRSEGCRSRLGGAHFQGVSIQLPDLNEVRDLTRSFRNIGYWIGQLSFPDGVQSDVHLKRQLMRSNGPCVSGIGG